MNSRLSRYREEWRLMQPIPRRTLVLALLILPMMATVCGFAVAEQNWLAVCLAIIALLAEAGVILSLRSASMYRHLYESTRDRPRAGNWRQN